MDANAIFKMVIDRGASDLHLCVGLPPMIRIGRNLEKISDTVNTEQDILALLNEVLPPEKKLTVVKEELDFALEVTGLARFRGNVYRDKNGICAALRAIPSKIIPLEQLGLNESVQNVWSLKRGLVLVTGPTGNGKSTTLASIIDKINTLRSGHIITIEDPIEFIHPHKKCVVNQREIGSSAQTFANSLRAALREDPDVILVGEMRDLDTISIAITAAETGHLVFATLHTKNAAQSISRIIDAFPPGQQAQIRMQLAESLDLVVSQVLVPSIDGRKRYLASEVMVATNAIRNLIRENHTHQIKSAIASGGHEGMHTLEQCLKSMVNEGLISQETAYEYAFEKSFFELSEKKEY